MKGLGFLLFLLAELWGLSLLAALWGRGPVLAFTFGKALLVLGALRYVLVRWLPRTLVERPEGAVAGLSALAGLALLGIPGLITDLLGLSLLIPGIRTIWVPWTRRWATRRTFGAFVSRHPPRSEGEAPGSPQVGPRAGRPAEGPSGRIVEADFRVLDD